MTKLEIMLTVAVIMSGVAEALPDTVAVAVVVHKGQIVETGDCRLSLCGPDNCTCQVPALTVPDNGASINLGTSFVPVIYRYNESAPVNLCSPQPGFLIMGE